MNRQYLTVFVASFSLSLPLARSIRPCVYLVSSLFRKRKRSKIITLFTNRCQTCPARFFSPFPFSLSSWALVIVVFKKILFCCFVQRERKREREKERGLSEKEQERKRIWLDGRTYSVCG